MGSGDDGGGWWVCWSGYGVLLTVIGIEHNGTDLGSVGLGGCGGRV